MKKFLIVTLSTFLISSYFSQLWAWQSPKLMDSLRYDGSNESLENILAGIQPACDEGNPVAMVLARQALSALGRNHLFQKYDPHYAKPCPKDVLNNWHQAIIARSEKEPFYKVTLGVLHGKGVVVDKDESKYVQLVQEAAGTGYPDACYKMGLFHLNGLNGVRIDYAKAKTYLDKAVAENHPNAYWQLGGMYFHGKGVPKDAAKYRELNEKGVELGSPYSPGDLAWNQYNTSLRRLPSSKRTEAYDDLETKLKPWGKYGVVSSNRFLGCRMKRRDYVFELFDDVKPSYSAEEANFFVPLALDRFGVEADRFQAYRHILQSRSHFRTFEGYTTTQLRRDSDIVAMKSYKVDFAKPTSGIFHFRIPPKTRDDSFVYVLLPKDVNLELHMAPNILFHCKPSHFRKLDLDKYAEADSSKLVLWQLRYSGGRHIRSDTDRFVTIHSPDRKAGPIDVRVAYVIGNMIYGKQMIHGFGISRRLETMHMELMGFTRVYNEEEEMTAALRHEDPAFLDLLIEKGRKIDPEEALFTAYLSKHPVDRMKRLVELGANPKAVDRNGKTLISHIAYRARTSSVEDRQDFIDNFQFLVEKGLDINVINYRGETALTEIAGAIHSRTLNFELYKALIKMGADPKLKNEKGLSFLEILKSKMSSSTIKDEQKAQYTSFLSEL